MVFEHVIDALVHGCGYERIATTRCSDRTIRRRLSEWADLGIASQLHALCLVAFDKMIGLQLGEISVDGCITKAPCGGEKAGPSPADRRKGGLTALDPKWNGGAPRTIGDQTGLGSMRSPGVTPESCASPSPRGSLSKLRDYLIEAKIVERISRETLRQILHGGGISWQANRTWKASRDPDFTAKMTRILDLYDHPPTAASGVRHPLCSGELYYCG